MYNYNIMKLTKKTLLIGIASITVLLGSGVALAVTNANTGKNQPHASVQTKETNPPKSEQTKVAEVRTETTVTAARPVEQPAAPTPAPQPAPVSPYPYATEISSGIWQVTDKQSVMSQAGIAVADMGKVDYVIARANAWKFAADGSYGLGQINTSKVTADFGDSKNPVSQVKWMQANCMSRYGSWDVAVDKTMRGHWVF